MEQTHLFCLPPFQRISAKTISIKLNVTIGLALNDGTLHIKTNCHTGNSHWLKHQSIFYVKLLLAISSCLTCAMLQLSGRPLSILVVILKGYFYYKSESLPLRSQNYVIFMNLEIYEICWNKLSKLIVYNSTSLNFLFQYSIIS